MTVDLVGVDPVGVDPMGVDLVVPNRRSLLYMQVMKTICLGH